ncbi:MAG: WYL domain-containing protein, partial [Eubacteriales bacterium]|nr:WYL domain-containing protein [Eubacteriales bacterium]
MADCNPKLKLLYVMEILLEQTDAQHTLTAQDICDRIRAKWGYHAERKGIYGDIAILQDYGLDITLAIKYRNLYYDFLIVS